MKRKRFSEEQIIAILKEHEAGVAVADLAVESRTPVKFYSPTWGEKKEDMLLIRSPTLPHGQLEFSPSVRRPPSSRDLFTSRWGLLQLPWRGGLTTVRPPVKELATSCGLWFLHHLRSLPTVPVSSAHCAVINSTLVSRATALPLHPAAAATDVAKKRTRRRA